MMSRSVNLKKSATTLSLNMETSEIASNSTSSSTIDNNLSPSSPTGSEKTREEAKKRASPFSANERVLLTELIEKRKDLLDNKRTDVISTRQKKDAWDLIEEEFCSKPYAKRRSQQQLKRFWENCERQARMNMAPTPLPKRRVRSVPKLKLKLAESLPNQAEECIEKMDSDEAIKIEFTEAGNQVAENLHQTFASENMNLSNLTLPSSSGEILDENKLRFQMLVTQCETELLRKELTERHLLYEREEHEAKQGLILAQISFYNTLSAISIANNPIPNNSNASNTVTTTDV